MERTCVNAIIQNSGMTSFIVSTENKIQTEFQINYLIRVEKKKAKTTTHRKVEIKLAIFTLELNLCTV